MKQEKIDHETSKISSKKNSEFKKNMNPKLFIEKRLSSKTLRYKLKFYKENVVAWRHLWTTPNDKEISL